MAFISQTFTIGDSDYVITDQNVAAQLAMQEKLINKLELLRQSL